MTQQKNLTQQQKDSLLNVLESRFKKHMTRHKGIEWTQVLSKLEKNPEKIWSLNEMEQTGGEPDVIGQENGEYLFVDCSTESPKGRRSLCYDRAAWEARKEHKPKDTAVDVATEMGIELLTEEEYMALQKLGEFDTKTSSWVKTSAEVRRLGGAVFADRRYNRVFFFHNGADSYYAARGFRGMLRV